MSPLTLDRIKKSNGNVRITEVRNSDSSISVMEYHLQILENNAWKTIYVDRDRTICEQAIRGANSRLIIG